MGRRTLIRASILGSLMSASLLIPIEPSAACSGSMSSHGQVFLDTFQGGSYVASPFYGGVEGPSGSATIRVSAGCSHIGDLATVRANYQANPGSAGASDYNVPPGTTGELCADADDQSVCGSAMPTRTVALNTASGDGPEPAVERFTVQITGRQTVSGNPTGAAVGTPSQVPVYVIDGEGAARASLEPGVTGYSRSETFSQIRVPVFMAGSSGGSVGFTITPDSAAPATPGQDFTASASPVPTSGGVGFIDIGIVNDKVGEGPESLIIDLSGTVDGQSTTKVTILDNEESIKPSSRFHHPRQGWRYKKSDYRIREFHVFTEDNPGGSGVVAAEIALRKNMKSGDCFWRTKAGWEKKDCSNREWLPTTYDDVGELWRLQMKQLKSSVGTNVKNYTAFSRATDGAENVENQFDEKRNANTFEIKRVRRR
jgi:hypothetical protein